MTISKEDVLVKLHQLPAMPAVIQKIIASFNNENLDSKALAEMISRDQGLSAKILRVANSPFYGLSRTIASMQEAVVVMGFSAVRSLVLTAGFVHAFPATPGSSFDRNAYWRHSFRVAGYAKALEQSLHQEPEMAFTAAMFHEIGQLVLDVCIPEQFAQVLQQHRELQQDPEFQQNKTSGLSLAEMEQKEFGFDHALIGAEMAKLWNFPPEIEHAIRYWAMPAHEPFRPLTGIVYAAVLLESGLRGEDFISHLPKTLCDKLGSSWAHIEAGLPDAESLDAGAALLLAA